MRILLVKTSSLGDIVHNLPVVADLVRAHPDAQIDWLVEETFAELPRLHPRIQRVIPAALRRWRRHLWQPAVWREIGAFLKLLRAAEYDLVIDSQGLLKSVLLAMRARLAAGGRRCGFAAASAREPLAARFYDAQFVVPWTQHAITRNRQLAAMAAGYTLPQPLDYGLCVPPWQAPWLPASDYVVLLTATARAEKLWPDPDWRALGLFFLANGIACVLPAGNATECARAEWLAHALPRGVAAPPLNLADLAGFLAGARLVVGVDTGLLHLAAALGRPTLGLYCATDPARHGVHAGNPHLNLGGVGAPPSAAAAADAAQKLLG